MQTSVHYDDQETADITRRELDIFGRLPAVVEQAARSPLYGGRLETTDAKNVKTRTDLAQLPILRKADLPMLQNAVRPFGGNLLGNSLSFSRFFASPGPIFEPEKDMPDAWGGARALHAAGFRAGDLVLNTLSYHLTPGGFAIDSAARALRCIVIPAGPANKDQQLDTISSLRPIAYCGTPDFLKLLRDASEEREQGSFSIRKAVVTGAAFPPSLQAEFSAAGIEAFQAYAAAEFGIIAFETHARDGLTVNENLIVEIISLQTGKPVTEQGEIGEVVITSLDAEYPLLRVALGDLSAFLHGPSASGHTNHRIKGWLGRADQATKVKGMFVRPDQLAALARRHPGAGKMRLVVSRKQETDEMTLLVERSTSNLSELELEASLQEQTKLRGTVKFVERGTLPKDGRIIADERPIH
ncbi:MULTISPECIES: AMP-binding protein [unclassified Afipia]|uniref:phenylacetate--CoA ligase family protein n=1 Tax=unclassified Afipia TaxID=2642050 RepID=UPI000426D71B|nr:MULTISPECIES: AMP-binding protein [unclassified Afipia]